MESMTAAPLAWRAHVCSFNWWADLLGKQMSVAVPAKLTCCSAGAWQAILYVVLPSKLTCSSPGAGRFIGVRWPLWADLLLFWSMESYNLCTVAVPGELTCCYFGAWRAIMYVVVPGELTCSSPGAGRSFGVSCWMCADLLLFWSMESYNLCTVAVPSELTCSSPWGGRSFGVSCWMCPDLLLFWSMESGP